jgi:hypothetical protein
VQVPCPANLPVEWLPIVEPIVRPVAFNDSLAPALHHTAKNKPKTFEVRLCGNLITRKTQTSSCSPLLETMGPQATAGLGIRGPSSSQLSLRYGLTAQL